MLVRWILQNTPVRRCARLPYKRNEIAWHRESCQAIGNIVKQFGSGIWFTKVLMNRLTRNESVKQLCKMQDCLTKNSCQAILLDNVKQFPVSSSQLLDNVKQYCLTKSDCWAILLDNVKQFAANCLTAQNCLTKTLGGGEQFSAILRWHVVVLYRRRHYPPCLCATVKLSHLVAARLPTFSLGCC